jgi:hypothetical protein
MTFVEKLEAKEQRRARKNKVESGSVESEGCGRCDSKVGYAADIGCVRRAKGCLGRPWAGACVIMTWMWMTRGFGSRDGRR